MIENTFCYRFGFPVQCNVIGYLRFGIKLQLRRFVLRKGLGKYKIDFNVILI